MLNSLFENINRDACKEHYYEIYQLLTNSDIEYEKITKKKMMDEIIKIYKNNPDIINYIYNEEELEDLYSLPEEITDNFQKVQKYADFFLYCLDAHFTKYTISLEIKEPFNIAKKIYMNSKDIIEREKKNQYISVGIFRTFGALTPKEFNLILQKLGVDKSKCLDKNYYLKRFVSIKEYNGKRNTWALNDLLEYGDHFIENHPKDIRLINDIESFEDIGCHYFDRKSPYYIEAMKHKRIKDFFDESSMHNFIVFAGSEMASDAFFHSLKSLLSKLTDKEENDLIRLFNSLPRYLLNKNPNNVLPEEDGKLFYQIVMPFLEYVGNKYGIEFNYYNNNYNGIQANEIIIKCTQDNFKYLANYLKENKLSDEEALILKNFKNSIKGPFIILKHLKNGSVFLDENNSLYLVKGIISPIEQMSGLSETPAMCDTFIFQFKNSIIYSSIIMPYQVQIVGNLKKYYMSYYEKNKDKIITRLS